MMRSIQYIVCSNLMKTTYILIIAHRQNLNSEQTSMPRKDATRTSSINIPLDYESLPIHRWRDDVTVSVHSKSSDLWIVPLHCLKNLSFMEIPEENKCIHSTRNNSSFGKAVWRRDPSQRTHETRMSCEGLREKIFTLLLWVPCPEFHCPISRWRCDPSIATYANATNL